VDISVGRLLKALDESRFVDNTLVIFTSDNGGHQVNARVTRHREVPPPYTFVLDAVWEAQEKGLKPNGDWRGQKGGIYEGGFRVPFLARWPGHIPPNAESGQMICLVDLMATLASLVGAPLPAPGAVGEDSFDFLPALLGKASPAPARKALILHSGNGTFAVRKGPWKWIEGIPAKTQGKMASRDAEELYDLAHDPSEKENLIRSRPEVADDLRAILNKAR
jgi:arylsulfatase A-like enzyme